MKTSTPNIQKRRQYDETFKRDAVEHVIRTGKPCAQAARELGIEPNMLARWRREYLQQADGTSSPDVAMKPSEMAEELRSTRMELEDLREQRDILKKALSIFGQSPRKGGAW